MKWTEDGWLRMADGSNLAKLEVVESSLPEVKMPKIPEFDDFDTGELGNWYYAPRIMPQSFADVTARPGYVRIRGQEARTSLSKVSILARKLTSVYATITTKMEFVPEIHQHSAGLILYYDNMNYVNLRKYYSETLGQSALSIIQLENGEKEEFLNTRIPVEDRPVYLRLHIEGRKSWFEWSYDGSSYVRIGREFDTTKYSDEYCKYGEFTASLKQLGFTEAELVVETDTYYTAAHHDFAALDEALRVRTVENLHTKEQSAVITYKGAKLDQTSMTRKELETEIGDAETGRKILENIGFVPVVPLHQIVGIAGVSGSGKSSLALGVLYAEGSRRYL